MQDAAAKYRKHWIISSHSFKLNTADDGQRNKYSKKAV